jgi:hypothetical protein
LEIKRIQYMQYGPIGRREVTGNAICGSKYKKGKRARGENVKQKNEARVRE